MDTIKLSKILKYICILNIILVTIPTCIVLVYHVPRVYVDMSSRFNNGDNGDIVAFALLCILLGLMLVVGLILILVVVFYLILKLTKDWINKNNINDTPNHAILSLIINALLLLYSFNGIETIKHFVIVSVLFIPSIIISILILKSYRKQIMNLNNNLCEEQGE